MQRSPPPTTRPYQSAGLNFCSSAFFSAVVAKRLRILDRIVGDAAEVPVLQLVVLERPRLEPRSLFEHDDRSPACASSRAITPPAAPEPTMTKSTVSESDTSARSFRFPRVDDEARIVAIVVAERRLKDMADFEANELPADAVAIAAVFGHREHAQQREQPRRLEERRAIDPLRYSICCVGVERRERGGAGMPLAKRRLKLRELRAIVAGELRENVASARSMKWTTPASRAPGVSSVGTICAATASTSAASAALRNDSFAPSATPAAACASSMACAIQGQVKGVTAVATMPAMAWTSDRREWLTCSMIELLDRSVVPALPASQRSRSLVHDGPVDTEQDE